MKKFLPYILILVMLVGLFSPVIVNAQSPDPTDGGGTCYDSFDNPTNLTNRQCKLNTGTVTTKAYTWVPAGGTPPGPPTRPPVGGLAPGTPGTGGIPLPGTPTISTPTSTKTNYQLLAPLPCEKGEGCVDKQQKNIDPGKGLGAYLNLMINLIIGIAAVLSVIMIVIGGMEYMTSELPGNKEHGRERMTNAVLGLLIALSAWALLNTINPDLLKSDVKIDQATVTVMLEGETVADAVTSDVGAAPTGPTILCSAGVQRTASGIFACGSIAQNLDNMIGAANNARLNITGGGYRSPDAQKALRIKNCNGNFTDRNAPCTRPTALPDLSRHNNGLAFDLKCNGTLIQSRDNSCFIWLKANASAFGLSNLSSEPWHWSTDGR